MIFRIYDPHRNKDMRINIGSAITIGKILDALRKKWTHINDERQNYHITFKGISLPEHETIQELIEKHGLRENDQLELMATMRGGL